MEIICHIVNNHGAADNVCHCESVGQHLQIGPLAAPHQRRQVACVLGVGLVLRIEMVAALREPFSAAGVALVNMKPIKPAFVFR